MVYILINLLVLWANLGHSSPHCKWIICYQKGTLDFGILFQWSVSPLTIRAYSDGDCYGCPYYVDLPLVFVCCWVQIKFFGLVRNNKLFLAPVSKASINHFPMFLSNLLGFFSCFRRCTSCITATYFLCDYISITYISSNPTFHAYTKHIELDDHFIREHLLTSKCGVQFISFYQSSGRHFHQKSSQNRLSSSAKQPHLFRHPILHENDKSP